MQDEWAAIRGLRRCLMEHIILDDSGRIRNLGALDYRIRTTKDVPLKLIALMVENGDGPGLFGAKGRQRRRPAVHRPSTGIGCHRRHGRRHARPTHPERVWKALNVAPGMT